VFQWVAKTGGKGVKKSAVKVRVKGPVSRYDAIVDMATLIAQQLDEGRYNGPKSVTV
jgi:hypothetical protein